MTKRSDVTDNVLKGDLFIPHFWAVVHHDGRGSVGPRSARFLVYFVDESDDPRRAGGPPVRESDQRSLTKGEFDAGVAENRRLEQINPSGGPMQHLIIAKTPDGAPARVGPARGSFFFTEGGQPFERQVDDIVFTEFDRFVRRNIPTENLTTRIVL